MSIWAHTLPVCYLCVVAVALESINKLNLFVVLMLLGDAAYLEIFELNQLYGLVYLALIFVLVLFPAVAAQLSPGILLPIFFAELSFGLWLLVKGEDGAAWEKRLRAGQS